MRRGQENIQVHECIFESIVLHTNAAVKFSCKMFIAWRNMSNKTFCRTANDNVTLLNGIATFNQTMTFQTSLLYNKATGKYLKKETSLCLLLISARKPEEEKLVGRIFIDLADVINSQSYSEIGDHKLSFCSIPNASLNFRITCTSHLKTDIKPIDLDAEEFSVVGKSLGYRTDRDVGYGLGNYGGPGNGTGGHEVFMHTSQEGLQKSASEDPSSSALGLNIKLNLKQSKERFKTQSLNVSLNHEDTSNYVTPLHSGRKTEEQILADLQQRTSRQKRQPPAQQKYPTLLLSPALPLSQPQTIQFQPPIPHLLTPQPETSQNTELQEQLTSCQQQLINSQKQCQKWKNMHQNAQHSRNTIQKEKDAVIALLSQELRSAHQSCAELNARVDGQSRCVRELQDVRNKLRELEVDYDQSQRVRLDFQSQLLEIRFQLSELKSLNQKQAHEISTKNQLIKRLQNIFSQTKQKNLKSDQPQASIISVLSQKEREIYHQQIQNLKKQVTRLTNDIQFTQNVKNNLSHLSYVVEQLSIEKETLLIQLSHLRATLIREKSQAVETKRQIQAINANTVSSASASGRGSPQHNPHVFEQEKKMLKDVGHDIDALEREVSRNEQQKVQLSQNVVSLQKQINTLTQQNNFLKSLTTQKQSQLSSTKQQLSQLSQSLQSLQSLQSQHKSINQALKKQIQALTMQLNLIKDIEKRRQSQSKGYIVKIQQLNAELEFVRNTLKEMEKEAEEKNKHVMGRINVARRVEEENAGLRGQIAKAKEDKEAEIRKLQQSKEAEIVQHQLIIASLQSEKSKQSEQIKQQKLDYDQLLQVHQTQSQSFSTTKQALTTLIQQHESLQQTVHNLNLVAQTTQAATSEEISRIGPLQKIIEEKNRLLEEKDKLIEVLEQNADSDALKMSELEERSWRFAEKEAKMRENILILEEESRKIFQIVMEKEENEEQHAFLIEEKDAQIVNLKQTILNKQLQLQALQLQQSSNPNPNPNPTPNPTLNPNPTSSSIPTASPLLQQLQTTNNNLLTALHNKQSQLQLLHKKYEGLQQEHMLQRKNKTESMMVQIKLDTERKKNSQLMRELRGLQDGRDAEIRVLSTQKKAYLAEVQRLKGRIKELLVVNEELILSRGAMQGCEDSGTSIQKGKLGISVEEFQAEVNAGHELQQTLLTLEDKHRTVCEELAAKEEELEATKILLQQTQLKLDQSRIATENYQKKYEVSHDMFIQLEKQYENSVTNLESVKSQLNQAEIQLNHFKATAQQSQKQTLSQSGHTSSQGQSLQLNIRNLKSEVKQLKVQLGQANEMIRILKNQAEDRQVEKMNVELHKQFESIKGKAKQEVGKNAEDGKNSVDIVEACNNLREILQQKNERERDKTEAIIEVMVSRNAALEQELYKITESRVIVQESARKLSMEFQKIKSKILKGKGTHQDKTELLSSLKPAEIKVKDLVELSEKIFDIQLDQENF